MLEAALNREQTSRLISLIRRAQSSNGQDSFTIKTYSELTAVRTLAANQYPDVSLQTYMIHTFADNKQFEKRKISVPHKNKYREYDVHVRPLMKWALSLVDHPRLAPKFTWDAEHISKYNGYKWIRVYHEPWTGDDWWSIQVSHFIFCAFPSLIISLSL